MKGKRKNPKTNEFSAKREALCNDLVELVKTRSEELIALGFSADLARFDCVHTLKVIVDGLYDECNVGHARREWYREYAVAAHKSG